MGWRTETIVVFDDVVINDPASNSSFSLKARCCVNIRTYLDWSSIPTGQVEIYTVIITTLSYKNIPVPFEMEKYHSDRISRDGVIDDPLSLIRTDDYEHFRVMKRFNAAIKTLGEKRFLTMFFRELRGFGGIKTCPLAIQVKIDLDAAIKKRDAFTALVLSKAGCKTPYAVLDIVFKFL